MIYNDSLDRELRQMLDPKGVQRKTVQQMVRECMESRKEAWRQAEKLALELAALRQQETPVTDGEEGLCLGEYWTRRT
ncbi:hypothetical protein [Caudoviricetes sp.]|nr:hypothetical protein [Caudoviricetes sp.]